MASKLSPTFASTTVYVKDVAKSVEFYAKAFGYTVRRLDESHRGYASPKICLPVDSTG